MLKYDLKFINKLCYYVIKRCGRFVEVVSVFKYVEICLNLI